MNNVEVAPIDFLRASVAAGEHWYIAMLKTMALWPHAEEVVEGRSYRYLIGGEAFDWLLLAERLTDELDGSIGAEDRDNLIFHGHPPMEIDDDEFQVLLGTPKYQAYLNFLYGVVVEEALQLAIEEEVAKEGHAHVWSAAGRQGETVFQRLYGQTQPDLLMGYQKERGIEPTDHLDLAEYKEFTYWLFKYRVRNQEGARVASDTRKGLVTLSRVEAASRQRLLLLPPESTES